jgi:hypothetical protein
MGDQKAVPEESDTVVDLFEPVIGDMMEEELDEILPGEKVPNNLAEKRRRAEARLEEKRLRDELGCYDLEFDDYR